MVIPQRWHQSERHSILGEKMKIYPQVLTFFIKPKTWLFHVVVLLTTATKWTKVKNARAGRAKLLFLTTKYANSWRSRCRRRCRCLSSLLYLYRDCAYFWLWPESVFLALTKRKADSGDENGTAATFWHNLQHYCSYMLCLRSPSLGLISQEPWFIKIRPKYC